MHATPADLAACRAMLRTGSRTFYAASFLLPWRVRASAMALYAFCRQADDAVDLGDGRLGPLERLHERLERAYAGRPLALSADRAFADADAQPAVPRALPEALPEGLAWDAGGRRYETLSDLFDYAARVAGSVGVMMAVVMGRRSPELLARASDLGIAMQITNIARDVGEDARQGRLYLPLSWLRDAGVDPDRWMRAPRFDARIGSVVGSLLAAAELLYARGSAGVAGLPAGCRPGIWAARWLYAEIGRQVERQGLDSVASRAVVPDWRKATALARAAIAAPAGRDTDAPALPNARFLIEPVLAGAGSDAAPRPTPARYADRAVWAIGVLERLERADRLASSS